jgi:hypothetical protein
MLLGYGCVTVIIQFCRLNVIIWLFGSHSKIRINVFKIIMFSNSTVFRIITFSNNNVSYGFER